MSKWTLRVQFGIAVYLGAIAIGLLAVPSYLFDSVSHSVVITIGVFGVWRFGWWTNHVVRALIYGRIVYPKVRDHAARVWASGARPGCVHFMITTFRERPEITRQVILSIISELRETKLRAVIFLGSGDAIDEDLIAEILEREASDIDVDLVIARQDRPGKRYAIGMALRAMRRARIGDDDVVVFMDGDAVIAPGMLAKCVPLFIADPKLEALTTDEEVVVHGPQWVAIWLAMRFAQRRLTMQSHALSGKVLTLTGRLSLFRAKHVVRQDFIEILEEDHLEHWLWGRFRFLSGDDKSTWYYMLRLGAKMTYVPDALSLTIEHIEGSGYERMVQNLRRWSGNMLRNGTRAIALGPRRVGFFIWWCLVDQRIAMWTMLISPVLAISAAVFVSPLFIITYLAWILMTRLMQSFVLWTYSREVHVTFPLFLYLNQLLNAVVKVYCLFRLSRQRWTNRGDQRAGFGQGFGDYVRGGMATYMTALATLSLVLMTLVLTGFVKSPSVYTFGAALKSVTRL